ncbi:MAG: hypothetical protein GXP30_01980 [Verrucomicrobia bacterium]|nr:hypothetical protein [Verrucomicrobiota bacterium]
MAASLENIRIRFGEAETACLADETGLQLNLASPHLSGPVSEVLFECEDAQRVSRESLHLLRSEKCTVGMAVLECGSQGIEAAAKALYDKVLEETKGLNLYRLWNFVPRINDESQGQENYRSFNAGRWSSFAEAHGEAEMNRLLPAATAVGLQEDQDRLAVVFLAGNQAVQYCENPRQTPAYQYPVEFGPCSPSFARGAVIDVGSGRVGYLSGTSSICGCETVGEGDLERQFSETIENIGEALKQMGFDGWPGNTANTATYSSKFRIYIRDAADFPEIRKRFSEVVGDEIVGQTVFIQADICRKPLKLEIEGVFRG